MPGLFELIDSTPPQTFHRKPFENVQGMGLFDLIDDQGEEYRQHQQRMQAMREEGVRRGGVSGAMTAGNEGGGIVTGLATAGTSIVAPAYRALGMPEKADELQHLGAAMSSVQQQNVQQAEMNPVRDWVNRYLPGAVGSVAQSVAFGGAGGTAGLVAGFGATEFDRSLVDARDAGLSDEEAIKHAAGTATAEAGVMLAFQALGKLTPGLEGFEQRLLQQNVPQFLTREWTKDAGRRFAGELVEEEITTFLQLVNEAAHIPGSENAANWKNEKGEFDFFNSPAGQAFGQTFSQTLLTGGLTEGGAALRQRFGERIEPAGEVADAPVQAGTQAPDVAQAPIDPVESESDPVEAYALDPSRPNYDRLPPELQTLADKSSRIQRQEHALAILEERDAAAQQLAQAPPTIDQIMQSEPEELPVETALPQEQPVEAQLPQPTPVEAVIPPQAAEPLDAGIPIWQPTLPPPPDDYNDPSYYQDSSQSLMDDSERAETLQAMLDMDDAELMRTLDKVPQERLVEFEELADESRRILAEGAPEPEQGVEFDYEAAESGAVEPVAELESDTFPDLQFESERPVSVPDVAASPPQSSAPSLPVPERPPVSSDPFLSQVHTAIANVSQGKERVYLNDLRAQFPDVPRADLDQALRNLESEQSIVLYPLDNPQEITQGRHEAALPNSVGKDRHIIYSQPRAVPATEVHSKRPMFDVYPLQDGTKFAVKQSERGGLGDALFDTEAEAKEYATTERRRVEGRAAELKKLENKEESDQKKQQEHEASFQGFLTDDPKTKGRRLKTLDASLNYKNKPTTRKALIEQKVADGWTVNDKGQLQAPTGEFLDERDLTKTGIDYARHLVNRGRDDVNSEEFTADVNEERVKFKSVGKMNPYTAIPDHSGTYIAVHSRSGELLAAGKIRRLFKGSIAIYRKGEDGPFDSFEFSGKGHKFSVGFAVGRAVKQDVESVAKAPDSDIKATVRAEFEKRRTAKAKKPSRAVGPRGQYALPGLEDAALDIENRESEVRKHAGEITEFVKLFEAGQGENVEANLKAEIPRLHGDLTADIERGKHRGLGGIVDDLAIAATGKGVPEGRREMTPAMLSAYYPQPLIDIAEKMELQAVRRAKKVGKIHVGDQVKYDGKPAEVLAIGFEETEVFLRIRDRDGNEREVLPDDVQKVVVPKTEKLSAKLRGAADKAKQKRIALAQAFRKEMDDLGLLTIPPPPDKLAKAVVAAVDLTEGFIEEGVLRFAAFVAEVAETLGEATTRKLAPFLEAAWEIAGETDDRLDPVGKVSDVLGEKDEQSATDGSDTGGRAGEDATDSSDVETDATNINGKAGLDSGVDATDSTGDVSTGTDNDVGGDAADGGPTAGGTGLAGDSRRRGRRDFLITDEDQIGGKFRKKERFRKNIEAVRLLKELEESGRQATTAEQEVLVQYVGWGPLKEAFSTRKDQWVAEKAELMELMTSEEFEQARATVNNAHYTSPAVIEAMWNGLRGLGFKGGRVLEPGVGIGHFFGMMPNDMMQESSLDAVEMDGVSARIAQQLYPSASVKHSPFQNVNVPAGRYDLVISNVPFGNLPTTDKFDKSISRESVHNFYFLKALKALKPGGVIAFITSRYTMDGRVEKHQKFRERMAEEGGRMIGAVRLPNNTFAGIADTKVTTDVIFIQKGHGTGQPWQNVMETLDGFHVNEYFHSHPDHVLGIHEDGAGTQPGEFGLSPNGQNVPVRLREIIESLPVDRDAMGIDPGEEAEVESEPVLKYDSKVHGDLQAGWTVVIGEKLYVQHDGSLYERPLPYKQVSSLARIKGMDRIRRVRRRLMELENSEDATDEEIEAVRRELNTVYDAFVKKDGFLSAVRNRVAFKEDDDIHLLQGMEHWDDDTKTATKSDVFSRRVERPYAEPTTASSPLDAVALSLASRGTVDVEMIGRLLGVAVDEVPGLIRGMAYENPLTRDWESADQYLSGNIAEKIKAAEEGAKRNAGFESNLKALREVLPKPLMPSQIAPRLRSPYIDTKHYEAFASHITGAAVGDVSVKMVAVNGSFGVNIPHLHNSKNVGEFGTPDRPAWDLLGRILNNAPVTVYRREPDGKSSVDQEATLQAQAKAEEINEEFDRWVYADESRMNDIVNTFNSKFNVWVEPRTDGSVLTDGNGVLPGSNQNIKLRKHQIDAVWRSITQGNELLAHEVGLGKTYIMAAIAMTRKRMGLANKQMVVVPNHLIEQFPREFKHMYPGAKILAPTPDQFTKSKRRQLLERVRNGDWDVVVVPMSSFKRIPMTDEAVRAKFNQQLQEIERAMAEARSGKNRNYISELEAAKKRLKDQMEKMLKSEDKDRGPFFDEIGIDGLIVDEAHEYKNLWFMTKMGRIPGINNQGNQTTFDMWMKTDYLNEKTGEKGITFATGTPISNSVSEMYAVQRYLQPSALKSMGIESFDAWANTFGEIVNDVEVTPTGSGFRNHSRFKKFTNVAQLSTVFRQVADVKYARDVGMDKDRPAVVGGKAKIIQAPPSLSLLKYVQTLVERMKSIKGGNKDDNALLVTTDGRKAATDMRLKGGEDIGWSKINIAVDNIYSIYLDTMKDKGNQIVWLDMGVPVDKAKKKNVTEGDEENTDDADGYSEDSAHDLYQDIKDKLVAKGMKPSEVAFIHDAGADAKKRQKLFANVNSGAVRVIVASTRRMGTGANVQDRSAAAHHLDAPWKPSDSNQRDGRTIRQGNIYKDRGGVRIFRYVSHGSFDAYIWQLNENKDNAIRQIMMGEVNDVEDIGITLDADEIKALASANPAVMEMVKLESEVRKLDAQRKGFEGRKSDAAHAVSIGKASIEYHERQLLVAEDVVAQLPKQETVTFAATIGGKRFGSFKEAGQAIMDIALADTKPHNGQRLAEIHGVTFHWNSEKPGWISFQQDGNAIGYLFKMSEDSTGNAQRFWNAFRGLYDGPQDQREAIARATAKVAEYSKVLDLGWDREEVWKQKSDRLRTLKGTVGNVTEETRSVTPLFKQAILARTLFEATGRPVMEDTDTRQWVFPDGTEIDRALVQKSKDATDSEITHLTKNFTAEQLTPDLFFNATGRLKSVPPTRPPGLKQPPIPREHPWDEGNLARRSQPSDTRPEGRTGPATTPEQQAADDNGPLSAEAIVKRVSQLFGVMIRPGRVPAGIDGLYKPHSWVVRLVKAKVGDLGLMAHEVAHHIDQTTNVLSSASRRARNEVSLMDYDPTRPGGSTAQRRIARKEGFAEYLRHWLTDPDLATTAGIAIAPAFHSHFEAWLQSHPEQAESLRKTRELIRRHADQSAGNRVQSQVSEGGTVKMAEQTVRESWDLMQNKFTGWLTVQKDRLAPLRWLDNLAEERGWKQGNRESKSYDLAMAFLNAAPQHALRAIENGVHYVSGRKKGLLGKGLVEIIEDAKITRGKDYDQAVQWVYARFAMELYDATNSKGELKRPNYNPGITREDAEAILRDAKPEDAKRYEQFGDGLTEFNNNLLRMLVDSGVITGLEAARMIAEYQNFIPLQRVYDKAALKRYAGNMMDEQSPVRGRSRKGSDAPILDPVFATIERANQFYKRAMDHEVLLQMTREADGVEGMGSLIEKVHPDMKRNLVSLDQAFDQVKGHLENAGMDPAAFDQDEHVIRVVHDGKASLYKVDPAIWKALSGAPPMFQNAFFRVWKGMVDFVKLGSVGINPVFAAANFQRDWKAFQRNTKYVKGAESLTAPFRQLGVYLAHRYFGRTDEAAQLFQEASGLLATRFGHGVPQTVDIRDSMLGGPIRRRGEFIRNWQGKARKAFHAVQEVASLTDVPVRLAEFVGALESEGYVRRKNSRGELKMFNVATGQFERPPRHVMINATNAASEVSVNFKRTGNATQFAGMFIPFFNASAESLMKSKRVYWDAAVKGDKSQGNRNRILVTEMSIAALTVLYWAMRHQDDDYEEEENWLKYGYWSSTDANGNPTWRLSRGYDDAWVPNLVEGLLNAWSKGDASELGDAAIEQAKKMMLPYGMAGLAPMAEAWGNWSFFRGQPLEYDGPGAPSPQYRTKAFTTETAKALGQITGWSPIKIDHIMDEATGGLGGKVVRLAEGGVRAVRTGETDKLWRAVNKLNPLSAFTISKDYDESTGEFYERLKQIETEAADLSYTGKEKSQEFRNTQHELNKTREILSDLRKLIENETDQDKRFRVENYMIGLSRWALGKSDLKRYGNPFTGEVPNDVREIVEEHLSRSINNAIRGAGVREFDAANESHQSVQSAIAFLQQAGVTVATGDRLLTREFSNRNSKRKTRVTTAERLERGSQRAFLRRTLQE
jgi:N12 class adenine-specific DNA methylase/adenine-specific DNA methylase